MMATPRLDAVFSAIALTTTMGLSACGASSSGVDSITLSSAAQQGHDIFRSNGCGSCHGSNDQGSVGPSFTGLFGSSVELDDGSVVIADRNYLIESITEPGAKKVAGYRLSMPTNRLSDDEIGQVIVYIEALASPTEESTP